MERRVLLAFLLSFLVFLAFVRFFAPETPEDPERPFDSSVSSAEADRGDSGTAGPFAAGPSAEAIVRAPGQEASEAAAMGAEGDAPIGVPAREAEREWTIRVETPLYRAEFTNRGGRLLGIEMREHRDGAGRPFQALPQGDSTVNAVRPLDVILPGDPSPTRLVSALFEVEVDGQLRSGPVELRLDPGETREVAFIYASADGLEVEKRVRLDGGAYPIGVAISARRGGAEQAKEILYGPGIGEEPASTGTYALPDQGVIKAGGESELYSLNEVAAGEAESLSAQAAGVASHYFAGLLVAEPGQRYEGRLETIEIPWDRFSVTPEDADELRQLVVARLASAGPAEFTLFAGPKQVEVLEGLGVDIVEFGAWLRYLVVPIREVLLWSHGFLGNYGWAIVFVTLLISILLAPLKHYSYVSMRRMQKISPLMKRIQGRYRGLKPTDPKRQEMNREMVELYREHKVSPLGGCLPMVLMIPFFFAFYRLLSVSVELRQAPFGLWIQDLSREDPYFILPIMMGVSQLLMQRMTRCRARDSSRN